MHCSLQKNNVICTHFFLNIKRKTPLNTYVSLMRSLRSGWVMEFVVDQCLYSTTQPWWWIDVIFVKLTQSFLHRKLVGKSSASNSLNVLLDMSGSHFGLDLVWAWWVAFVHLEIADLDPKSLVTSPRQHSSRKLLQWHSMSMKASETTAMGLVV